MSDVIIFGTGQIAELAHFYLENDSDHTVKGFMIDKDYLKETEFKGLPVVPFEELEDHFPANDYKLFLPISYKGINQIRKDRYLNVKKRGYGCISYISSKASYFGTSVGENCFIMEDNTIQPFTQIGNNVIMWSGNHFGHHSVIGDHCFIASHVVISGSVTIGERCFVGVNATIRDNITIGAESVIGAGSTINKSLPEQTVTKPEKAVISPVKSSQLKEI